MTNFGDYLQEEGPLFQACVCLLISSCGLLRGPSNRAIGILHQPQRMRALSQRWLQVVLSATCIPSFPIICSAQTSKGQGWGGGGPTGCIPGHRWAFSQFGGSRSERSELTMAPSQYCRKQNKNVLLVTKGLGPLKQPKAQSCQAG